MAVNVFRPYRANPTPDSLQGRCPRLMDLAPLGPCQIMYAIKGSRRVWPNPSAPKYPDTDTHTLCDRISRIRDHAKVYRNFGAVGLVPEPQPKFKKRDCH